MLILKKGRVSNEAKRFVCIYCGTIFRAEYGEYENASQFECARYGVVNRCVCPVCKRITFNGVDM